jgi:TPR repeat protein
VYPVSGQSRATPEEKYQQAIGALLAAGASQTARDEALNLLQSAAEQNYVPAQTALGTFYAHGGSAPRDMAKAVDWFTKAAEHDDWIAQLALGRIYFMGDGVPQDSSRARQWLFRAADSGDGVSAFYLALLYDGRLGAATDHAEAAKWYRQSAETGNPYAQEKLANLLFKGLGVAQDQKEAYIWLLVAVEFGNSGAMLHLNSIEGDLGPTAAKAAREQAVDLRREILARRSRNPCSGWPGQYDIRPVAPPLSYLVVCEGDRVIR